MMELNPVSRDLNDIPLEQYAGLTTRQLYFLVNEPLQVSSPLKLRTQLPNAVLDNLPFFRSCEDLLGELGPTGKLKLTPSGALNKKTLHLLYEKCLAFSPLINKGVYKLIRQENWNFLDSVGQVCAIAGLLKKEGANLVLSKKAVKLMVPVKRSELFAVILNSFCLKFNWAYNDGYSEENAGQIGWAYTVWLLIHHGGEPKSGDYYAKQYIKAFPSLLDFFQEDYISAEEDLANCYNLRALSRFAAWFGFLDYPDDDFEIRSPRNEKEVHEQLTRIFTINGVNVIN